MAIYDILTPNESFIEMHTQLKSMGIKNNKFFLILYDETLQGVDPCDEKNLTEDQKIRIQIEVQRNFWYYIREVIRIKESGGFCHYGLHLGNLAQNYCMLNDINVIELLPRQHGKTIGAVCFYTWVFHFATENSNLMFGNKAVGDAEENLKRFKDTTELLPSYLKRHLNVKDDTDNVQHIRCAANNNTIKLLKAASDPNSADKAGRGLTVPIIWIDEFSFLKYNDIIFDAAAPAQSKAAERAQANKVPNGILLTTTPSTLDDPAGFTMYDMLNQSVDFSESWYDLDIEEVKEIIQQKSKNNFVHIEYSYQQLGRDEEWYKQQCRKLRNNLFKIKREILLEWMFASNDSPFSEEQLEGISVHLKDPLYKITIDNRYVFNVLQPLSNLYNKSWIVAIDIATGMSSDYSAITVIDPLTSKPAIVFRDNTIDIPDLVVLVEKFVTSYLPNAVIVPERNSIGIPFINLLLKTSVGSQIYYEVKVKEAEKNIESSKMNKTSVKKVKKEVRCYGVFTDQDKRKIMLEEILFDIVNNAPDKVGSKDIFNEIKGLVRTNRDRIDHKKGAHDDMLMSWMIGLYALYYGKNINRFIKVVSNNESAPNNSTKAVNRITNMSNKINSNLRNNKLNDNNFTLTNKMLERYSKIQKEIENSPGYEQQSYGEVEMEHQNSLLATDKIKGKTSKKKINKKTLSMLSSFNKR